MNGLVVPAVWVALAASLVAAAAFWGSTVATGPKIETRLWLPFHRASLAGWWKARAPRLARAAVAVAALFLIAALFLRWTAAGRPPWTNMWEFSVALSASIAAFCVVIKPGIHALPAVGGVVQSMVVVLLLGSLLFFSSATDPLVPALQSEGILALHVGFMLASYGALSLSFGAGVVRLIQGDRGRIAALPPAQALDRLSHASVVVAFPLLTVGILLGAYWANDAWGRYWAWDPKETAALVTWFIYAAYLHVHRLAEWRGTRSAAILIAGYAAVMFTYFGVNLWISGLHSYA